MKNNNIQELRPVYIHENSYKDNDEVNLIDLVVVLIRHKAIFTSIFVLLLASGILAALLLPQSYTYTTTIEIGRQVVNNAIQPLDSPQTLLAKLQHGYIPQVLVEYRLSHPDDNRKYEINSSVSGSGGLILLLTMEGHEDKATIIKSLLQKISLTAIQDHNLLYGSLKTSLKESLNETTSRLKFLEGNSTDNESEIAEILMVIESLKFQLANLRDTREVLPAVRSAEPTGLSRTAIILASVATGLLLGAFSAFFAELVAKIKRRQTNSVSTPDDIA